MSADRNLFGEYVESWRDEWIGMPEFVQENKEPWKTITLAIPDEESLKNFRRYFGNPVGQGTYWYPRQGPQQWTNAYFGGERTSRYPIYIVSKGRWEKRQTARALERSGVPYRIVVEPQEHENYARVIDPTKILTLPFSNLGQGSIPARNWIWQHSIDEGWDYHWILDDNIRGFMRLNRNTKRHVFSAVPFRVLEDFVERYTNIALSGFHYQWFITHRSYEPPYRPNRRIYSCILIRNDLPYRWRGRYNEDTDLSLRALKDGWCTVLLNVFLADKTTTMMMSGGNTDELYSPEDGRLKMAESLVEQHPDVARITWKWGRWQHYVDYRPFQKNQLKRRSDIEIPKGVNEYGMELREITEESESPEGLEWARLLKARLLREEAWAATWNRLCDKRRMSVQTTRSDFKGRGKVGDEK